MLCRTPILILTISLILLAAFPTISVTSVRGVAQNGPTVWSPFGPREQKLTITDYSDSTTMFNAFLNGQVDIPDSAVNAPDLSSFCSNADFYCTSPTPDFSMFFLDINHHQSFLGASLQENRTVTPPSFISVVTKGTGCTTGFSQLTVHLQNQEQGNASILDSINKLTITNQPSGSPSATVSDSGASKPTGTYVFPCILAGTYKITSSIYTTDSPCSTSTPTSCITIGSGQAIGATFIANWNSPSTKEPSKAGVYVGSALDHLIDKPSFTSGLFGNKATFIDQQASPAQNVPNLFSNTAECADHPWFTPCNPVSAYNFVGDSVSGGSEWWTLPGQAVGAGPGYSGYADLRAACDDFVRAGFTIVNGANATDCGNVALASLGASPPASSAYPHLRSNGQQINFIVRPTAGRRQLGVILGDTVNFLFGTPNNGVTFPGQTPPCSVIYNFNTCRLTFPQIQFACVFQDTCSWNLYTDGESPDITPTQLYVFFYSSFASNHCGGQTSPFFLQNFAIYCDPRLDTYAAAGELSPTISQSIQLFANAALAGELNGMTVPIYSPENQFMALNGWNFQQCTSPSCSKGQSSIVNGIFGIGRGASGTDWTLLNARQVPGYVSSNPIFTPGGGDPNLIRRGFSNPDETSCFSFNNTQNCTDTIFLSPFNGVCCGQSEILGDIFDSMLQPNPITGGLDGQVIDWQTISHSFSFNPNEMGCNSLLGCGTGITTQLWHLRNDLYFQDGTPVTANDVAYSIIAYRDVPSNSLQNNVFNVVSAQGLDCSLGQSCKTLQVKLQGQSPLDELNIGTLPIIPKHVWAPFCGDPPNPTSQCADPSFDPMIHGIMIGDGPWQCLVPARSPNAGHVGGSCVVNPDGTLGGQTVVTGSKFLLTRYDRFARCCPDDTSSSLYKLSWADSNNDGVVSILDLASAAVRFGQPDPYWVNSNIAPGTTVNIQDLATVAFYFGHGTTYPFKPSQLTGLDPQIDPFFCPNPGC